MDEFEKACRTSILTPFDSTRVTELQPSTTSTVRVIVEGGSAIGRIYDAVILAIGFGLGDPSFGAKRHCRYLARGVRMVPSYQSSSRESLKTSE